MTSQFVLRVARQPRNMTARALPAYNDRAGRRRWLAGAGSCWRHAGHLRSLLTAMRRAQTQPTASIATR